MARLILYNRDSIIVELDLNPEQEVLIGRSLDCDIVIEDESISRKHIKIVFDNDHWKIECLSKFSLLSHTGDTNLSEIEINDDIQEVWFSQYRIFFDLDSTEEQLKATEVLGETEALGSQSEEDISFTPDQDSEVDFESGKNPTYGATETDSSFDEKTQFYDSNDDSASHLEPYIRLTSPGVPDEVLKLEGESWTAGRDEDCQIQINHPRASREHFEIVKSAKEYFVIDLNSSNGTNLNGEPLNPGTRVPLDSGDRLEIKEFKIYFELRDPRFQKQLQVLQKDLDSFDTNDTAYLPGPAGAVRIPPPERRTKKSGKARGVFRIIVISVILGALYIGLNDVDSNKKDLATEQKVPKNVFDSLPPEKQALIESKYRSADKFYKSSKYELALAEIRTIHETLPNYKDSRDIERYSRQAIETLRQQEELERMQAEESKLKSKVHRIVSGCERNAYSKPNIDKTRTCLQKALELDPENQKSRQIIAKVEALVQERRRKLASKEHFQAQVRRGIASYQKAKSIEAKGKLLDAIDAYQHHLNSSYPDPKKFKEKSKRSIQSIRTKIEGQVSKYVSEANKAHDAQDYKTAILTIRKALALDPQNSRARDQITRSNKELLKKTRVMFQDAILEENLGNIENAKGKWKKIVEIDVPDGEYYKKSKIKMKKYGP